MNEYRGTYGVRNVDLTTFLLLCVLLETCISVIKDSQKDGQGLKNFNFHIHQKRFRAKNIIESIETPLHIHMDMI